MSLGILRIIILVSKTIPKYTERSRLAGAFPIAFIRRSPTTGKRHPRSLNVKIVYYKPFAIRRFGTSSVTEANNYFEMSGVTFHILLGQL